MQKPVWEWCGGVDIGQFCGIYLVGDFSELIVLETLLKLKSLGFVGVKKCWGVKGVEKSGMGLALKLSFCTKVG